VFAVDLHDQHGVPAGEVGNVRANHDLAAELRAFEALGAEFEPEFELGTGELLPHRLRAFGELSVSH
jgi:hypothetical protein